MLLTAAHLDRRWPHAPHSLVDGIVAAAPAVLPKFGLDAPLVLAHFLSHCSVECAAGTSMEENLHYSAERLVKVWPKRFPTLRSAMPYAHDPRLLADKVYNGRMGNRPNSDDGWNCRGRGLIDITGHDEYEKVGKECGLDLVANPNLAAAPDTALIVAAAFYKISGAIPFAAKDDITHDTEHVNGGLNGLAERKAWLRVWKAELGLR
jgi:putative chitinase